MKETQEKIDSHEYAEWLALYLMVPWGDDWEQTGLQCSIIGSTVGAKIAYKDAMKGEGLQEQEKPPGFNEIFSVLKMAEPKM